MTKSINGVVPVMITPFAASGGIDYRGLARLIEWYIAHGADALFAVCQSSEMQFLSLDERVDLAAFVTRQAAGRVPVLASGHISETLEAQREELTKIAATGVDALVLVTNRLDARQQGGAKFLDDLGWLLDKLAPEMPLGLYECPAPYRRLLTDDELTFCARSSRFVVLKDVSCDLTTVKRRLALAAGTGLSIVNANAAIATGAMRAGARGFSGVFTNFHPDLYKWQVQHCEDGSQLSADLEVFMALAAMAEPMGYPKLAKLYHRKIGTFEGITSRAVTFDIAERFWALDVLLDQIHVGTERFRQRIREAS